MKCLLQNVLLAFAFVCVVVAGLPEETLAHGEAGLTFTATSTSENGVSRYVDVDYTELAIIARDSSGRFTFNLFADAERTQPVNYTDMWVRIVENNDSKFRKTVFAGPIYRTEFGGVGFLFTFPDSGKYTLHVRYNDANKDNYGETLAEAEFPLDVLRSLDENSFDFGSMEFMVGLLSGAFVALLGLLPMLMRKRSA